MYVALHENNSAILQVAADAARKSLRVSIARHRHCVFVQCLWDTYSYAKNKTERQLFCRFVELLRRLARACFDRRAWRENARQLTPGELCTSSFPTNLVGDLCRTRKPTSLCLPNEFVLASFSIYIYSLVAHLSNFPLSLSRSLGFSWLLFVVIQPSLASSLAPEGRTDIRQPTRNFSLSLSFPFCFFSTFSPSISLYSLSLFVSRFHAATLPLMCVFEDCALLGIFGRVCRMKYRTLRIY